MTWIQNSPYPFLIGEVYAKRAKYKLKPMQLDVGLIFGWDRRNCAVLSNKNPGTDPSYRLKVLCYTVCFMILAYLIKKQ